MKLVKLAFLSTLFLFGADLYGQFKKVKFGKIPKEQIALKVYEPDSSADAVILHDIGFIKSYNYNFKRNIRVKILKKTGLDWANWTFPLSSKADFKVSVYNEVDGNLEETRLSNENIYVEEVFQGYDVYKVFAPNVKVGSIIEIEYYFFGLPGEWTFQERIPTMHSELYIEEHPNIKYNKAFFGFEGVETVSNNHWKVENMPAFKSEPYLNNYRNYLTKMRLQITRIGWFSYPSEWERVVNSLSDYQFFGGVIEKAPFLNDYAEKIKNSDLTVKQKIDSAYSFIRRNISWNGNRTFTASGTYVSKFKKTHSGGSGDMNLLLVSLLKKMDIETYPVVLSTRSNGILTRFSPSIRSFDYVVAYVVENDMRIFLDATDKYAVPGVLPQRCLNGFGLLINKGEESWLDLHEDQKAIRKSLVEVEIDDDMEASVSLISRHMKHSYTSWMNKWESAGQDNEAFKNRLSDQYPDLMIEEFSLDKNDKGKMMAQEKISIDLTDQLIDADESFFLNPIVMFDYLENPFKAGSRKYPVDFGHLKSVDYTLKLKFPDGYTIKELPQSVRTKVSDEKALFEYRVSSSANSLNLSIKVRLNTYAFTEVEYLELKNLFSFISEKANTPIEFIKKT